MQLPVRAVGMSARGCWSTAQNGQGGDAKRRVLFVAAAVLREETVIKTVINWQLSHRHFCNRIRIKGLGRRELCRRCHGRCYLPLSIHSAEVLSAVIERLSQCYRAIIKS